MSVANPLELLLDHVGHTLVVVEKTPGRSLGLRCRSTTCPGYNRVVDLSRLLGDRPSSLRTTSTSQTPAPRDPTKAEQCPAHLGEFREACRCCAAEAKARKADDPPPISHVRSGADPSQIPEWQRVRDQLAARDAQRKREQRAAAINSPDPAEGATA